MRLQSFLILIGCAFANCTSHSQSQKKLAIPDSISVPNNGQQQVYGTHIFMTEPEGFKFNFSTNRFERNDTTYIKIVETPTASYSDKYNRFTELIKEENVRGFETYYQKEFKLNNKEAIILYGLDREKTTEQIILLFGDNAGSSMILSRFAVGDNDSKDVILNSLLSAFKADAAPVDISSLQNFTVDMLDTKFKYNSTTMQMFFYTLNGMGDPGGRKNEEMIVIGQMPPADNESLIEEKAHSVIENFRNIGIDSISYKEEKVIIDKKNAYTITFTGKFNDKKVVVYALTLGNVKSTIYFQGIAYDNQEMYLQQFKQVAQTLRLKE